MSAPLGNTAPGPDLAMHALRDWWLVRAYSAAGAEHLARTLPDARRIGPAYRVELREGWTVATRAVDAGLAIR